MARNNSHKENRNISMRYCLLRQCFSRNTYKIQSFYPQKFFIYHSKSWRDWKSKKYFSNVSKIKI